MAVRPRLNNNFPGDLPDYIDLVPNANGGYSPDFTIPQRPPPAPIDVYRPPEDIPLYQPPAPASTPPPRSQPFGDAEAAAFGVDAYGRPVVVRRPDGSYGFNDEMGFTPQEMADADDYINGRQPRTPAGGRAGSAARNVGRVADALGTVVGLLGGPEGAIMGASGALVDDALANRQDQANNLADQFGVPRPFPGTNPLPNGPGGEMEQPGAGGYPQGQCQAVYLYEIHLTQGFPFGVSVIGEGFGLSIQGPIAGLRDSATPGYFEVVGANGDVQQHGSSNYPQVSIAYNGATLRIGPRVDGQGDTCGQPLPGLAPTPAPTTNPDASPQPYPQPYPYPYPYPVPSPSPSPLPSPQPYPDGSNPFPSPSPSPQPSPAPLPSPSPLPSPYPWPDIPPPYNPTPPASPPTPDRDCCGGGSGGGDTDLSGIEALLREALARLEGEGTGTLDLSLCERDDDYDPTLGLYAGSGLAGIYAALSKFTESLNLIHSDTKCPPDVNAALPMFWEMKVGEVPQLVVIWRKITPPGEPVSGSTWSMTIPHPRDDIGPDYEFSFPDYMKGGNMASMRLTDNSQVIVNAGSEPEAQKILDYVSTLIDPDFIPQSGLKTVYSKGVAEYAEVDVKAVYVKKFAGHKTTAPLWGRHIS